MIPNGMEVGEVVDWHVKNMLSCYSSFQEEVYNFYHTTYPLIDARSIIPELIFKGHETFCKDNYKERSKLLV